ncbi:MAG: PTS transporter subunit EIIC [Acidimicrobiales bacterium]
MFAYLQRIGRALMMPIAVLPAAGLLLRIGVLLSVDSVDRGWDLPEFIITIGEIMRAGGDAVFGNLPLLFAIGVAIGFTEGAGAAGLAAGVGYLVLKAINDARVIDPTGGAGGTPVTVNMGVLGGILIGLAAAHLYDRFKDMRLPSYLAFFGGRRLIPILTAGAAVVIGAIAWVVWPPIGDGIDAFGDWIVGAGAVGAFIYGVANRGLLPIGLHHIINTLVWFQFGTFTAADGTEVTGDIPRFLAGDPRAGLFMAGWFFIMMFGLPAAALAMWLQARARKRAATGAIMQSSALTSVVTGITEPIEFSFLFPAMPLYVAHAVLSGIALVVADAVGIRHGFSFSAGFIDYVLYFGNATRPLLIIPIGLAFAVVYYVLFFVGIRVLDLETPGREEEELEELEAADEADEADKAEEGTGAVTAGRAGTGGPP